MRRVSRAGRRACGARLHAHPARRGGCRASSPPSSVTLCPLIHAACGDASDAIACATSSRAPRPPSGMRAHARGIFTDSIQAADNFIGSASNAIAVGPAAPVPPFPLRKTLIAHRRARFLLPLRAIGPAPSGASPPRLPTCREPRSDAAPRSSDQSCEVWKTRSFRCSTEYRIPDRYG
jgi:hypothetical protein